MLMSVCPVNVMETSLSRRRRRFQTEHDIVFYAIKLGKPIHDRPVKRYLLGELAYSAADGPPFLSAEWTSGRKIAIIIYHCPSLPQLCRGILKLDSSGNNKSLLT